MTTPDGEPFVYPPGWRSKVDDLGHWLYRHHLCTMAFEWRCCNFFETWVSKVTGQ